MIQIRKLNHSDLEPLKDFWNQNVIYDPITLDLLNEKLFGDPDYAPKMTLLAFDNAKIVAFMQGIIRKHHNEQRGWIKLFATDQDYRRQGLATRLLNQIEAYIRNQGVVRIGLLDSAPNYFQPGIDPFYTPAIAFAERRGYHRIGDTSNLKADLTSQDLNTAEEEKAALQRGISIRRAATTDQPCVLEFLQKYFFDWIYEVNIMFKHDPITLHLAFLKGELVAFSGHNGNNLNSGWFGPMGTDPNKRGLGIGGILLKRCLQDIKEQGFESSIIPWVGPIPFYMHYANAHVCRIFWRYEKQCK